MILYYFAELAARPIVKTKLSGFLCENLQIFPQFGAILVDKGLARSAALTPPRTSH